MGATSPDNIRYPSDYNQPGDVPNDMQILATDVQTALNTKPDTTPVGAAVVTLASGFGNTPAGYVPPRTWGFGKTVFMEGVAGRTSDLAVTDNGTYSLGTVAAWAYPRSNLMLPTVWRVHAGGTTVQNSVCHMRVSTAGAVSFIANIGGTMKAADDWISFNAVWLAA